MDKYIQCLANSGILINKEDILVFKESDEVYIETAEYKIFLTNSENPRLLDLNSTGAITISAGEGQILRIGG